MVFPVAMSQVPCTPVKVALKTKDRTANAGSDYQETAVTLEFKAGKPADPAGEGADQRRRRSSRTRPWGLEIQRLSGPATAVDNLGVGRIVNDDVLQPSVQPALSVDDLQVDEPPAGRPRPR